MDSHDSPRRKPPQLPDFSHELGLFSHGFGLVAGVDEAGRGPLAGPVVVAAVVLDPQNVPEGLNDSKKLSAPKREILFTQIFSTARVGLVSAPPAIIKRLNIRGATLWAMAKAVHALATPPDYVLVDGRDIPAGLSCPAEALVKGDGRSVSIAAASIVAKVCRDRMCAQMESVAPGYGFLAHKGYGTARHLEALNRLGACAHHRALFAPVAKALARQPAFQRIGPP